MRLPKRKVDVVGVVAPRRSQRLSYGRAPTDVCRLDLEPGGAAASLARSRIEIRVGHPGGGDSGRWRGRFLGRKVRVECGSSTPDRRGVDAGNVDALGLRLSRLEADALTRTPELRVQQVAQRGTTNTQ